MPVAGKLNSADPAKLEGNGVVLIQFDREADDDKLSQLGITVSDAEGKFAFEPVEPVEGMLYLVGIVRGEQRFPSRTIRYFGQAELFFDVDLDRLTAAEAPPVPEERAVVVKGRLLASEAGQDLAGTELMLLRIMPDSAGNAPPMVPVIGTQTDSEGGFEFPRTNLETGSSYLVGALFEGTRFSSEPVEYRGQESLFFFLEAPKKGSGQGDGKSPPAGLRVKVKLVGKEGVDWEGTPLMLLQFDPQAGEGTPPMSPLIRGEADGEGEHEFVDVQPRAGVSYLVGAFVDGRRVSTPMKPYRGEKRMNFVLEMPSFATDFSKLLFLKSFLVFTPLNEGVRVTEITQVANPGRETLFSSGDAPSKPLPKEALNARYFVDELETEVPVFEGGRFFLREIFPPGEKSLFIEYDLPRRLGSTAFDLSLFPGTKELELMAVKGGLTLRTPDLFMERKEREIDGKNYETFVARLEAGTGESLRVEVGGLPKPNRYFIVAGVAVTLPMLLTMLVFLIRRRGNPSERKPA